MKQIFFVGFICLFLTTCHKVETEKPTLSQESAACYNCHLEKTPSIAKEWAGSRHGNMGIGCYECHQADEKEVDAWKHEGKIIATIITPKDCATCHADVVQEFTASHHAKGGEIL